MAFTCFAKIGIAFSIVFIYKYIDKKKKKVITKSTIASVGNSALSRFAFASLKSVFAGL